MPAAKTKNENGGDHAPIFLRLYISLSPKTHLDTNKLVQ